MGRSSEEYPIGILARQVPGAIRFLRNLEVPAPLLADIFGETADSIRHTDDRAYKDPAKPDPVLLNRKDRELLGLSDGKRAAQYKRNMQGIRLRAKQDLDLAERSVWRIFENHRSVGMDEGYAALREMIPGVANASHGDAFKVRLLIEEKLAWFALNRGVIQEALVHARAAMAFALDAFRESAGVPGYLLRYGEAALVVSVCLQKMHQPRRAIRFIRAADDANLAIGQLPGSEHLRQRAVSILQVGASDEEAEKNFKEASERMDMKGEARHEVDISMTDIRQRSYIDPANGWDKVLELVHAVTQVYGEQSLQFNVVATSAAATGLKYATPISNETSLNLLAKLSPVPPDQIRRGVPHILSITPDLKLSPEKLDRWLRFAISETPRPPSK